MEMSQAGFSAHYSQVNKLFENKSTFAKQTSFADSMNLEQVFRIRCTVLLLVC